jgi:phi13 family phage major tail protein
MAKIGLNNFRYGILTEGEDGTPSYAGAKKPAKAVSCNVEVTNNEAKLFADDALAESDSSFAGGTVTMGIDNEDDQTMADMLGHEITEGEMVRNANDVAPYLGLGRVVTLMVNGVYKYRAEFLYKCKFSEPSQENTTKGENLEFGTSEIEGTVNALADGRWSATETFNTKAEAIAYIEEKLGGVAPHGTTYTVTYDANGGTGSVAPATVEAGDSITLSDGTGLTAPEGKTFAGWAKTSSAQSATVSSPFTPTGNVTLYAVYVTE